MEIISKQLSSFTTAFKASFSLLFNSSRASAEVFQLSQYKLLRMNSWDNFCALECVTYTCPGSLQCFKSTTMAVGSLTVCPWTWKFASANKTIYLKLNTHSMGSNWVREFQRILKNSAQYFSSNSKLLLHPLDWNNRKPILWCQLWKFPLHEMDSGTGHGSQ